MSDSSRPHGPQPTRLLHPWDSPGKSTGVGCQGIHRSKFDSQRAAESDSWREGKEGQVKPTALPEARAEAGAHGRTLQNKKTTAGLLLLPPSCFSRVRLCATLETAALQAPPQGYMFLSREAGDRGQPLNQEHSQETPWLMTRCATGRFISFSEDQELRNAVIK